MAVPHSYSRYYHDSTKYAVDRLGGGALDWSAQPEPFKDIVTQRKIELSPYLPFHTNEFNPKLESGQRDDATPQEIGPARLSRLLYFTNGVTKIMNMHVGAKILKFLMRAAPSAGGLYPTEIYVAIRNCRHFPSGIYNYQVRDHSIIPLWDGDNWKQFDNYCFRHPALAESDLLVLLSVLPFRSSWRYKERGYRRCLLDTGHVIGNLVAYGQREGFLPEPIGGFWDSAFNGHLFFDDREEVLLAAVAMPLMAGRSESAAVASNLQASAKPAVAPGIAAAALKSPPRERPDVASIPAEQISLHLHRLSCIEGPLDPTLLADLVPPAPAPAVAPPGAAIEALIAPRDQSAWKHELGQTILMRRSTRGFTAGPLAREQLAAVLAYGYRQGATAAATAAHSGLFAPEMLETYLLALNVTDLPAGAYRYLPEAQHLVSIREGDFRSACHHFCLQQELGRDAAAVVVHTVNLPAGLERYGERIYRYAHLDSGHLGQRMNLAAIAMELGVSGIGGFFDDEINTLLKLSTDYIITYVTTLGQPA